MTTHVFSGNPLDRGDVQRRDEDWLAQAARDPRSRFLPLWQLDILLCNGNGAELGWVAPADIERLAVDGPPVFLGLMDGTAHFAVDVSTVEEPLRELNLEEPWSFVEARAAAAQLKPEDVGILAHSKSQVDWHRRHRFCGLCGAPTEQGRGGQVRKCTRCNTEHFPRTDPVAIMVVTDGERALLGQSRGRLARSGRYSALAGFIDQAECIEEAVRREIKEESGIIVGEVRYHSSQPWPFPFSLMIGCHGKALSTNIVKDDEEMTDVRWFSREEVLSSLAGENPNLKLPDPVAIAHHLIRAWAEGRVKF